MNIYIEKFILQNMLVNFCLIKLVNSTTKIKTKFIKIFFASLFGACINTASIYFLDTPPILNLLSTSTACIMLAITFKTSMKQQVFNLILYTLYSYAFSGITMSMNTQTYFTSFGMVTTSKFNMEIMCLFIIIATYVFDLVLRHIRLKIHTNNLIYDLTLYKGNRKVKINAYLDTGNFINQNGQPVLILDLKTFLKLTQTDLLQFLSNKSEIISTSTINGNDNLRLFYVDKICITQPYTGV